MKYIALDFDGTLLNSNGKLTETTKNYLIELQEQGYVIILCSGRSSQGMQEVADEIDVAKYNGYIVSYNGGHAKRAGTGEVLFSEQFNKDTVNTLHEELKADFENFVTYGHGTINAFEITPRIIRSAEVMKAEITQDVIVDTPKVVLQDDPELIGLKYDAIKIRVKAIDSSMNVFRSVPQLIEITPKDSSKGVGLEKLFKIENLDANRLIAFGDGENDVTMLEYAKLGVAMDNAMDSVKAVANDFTQTNNEEGVVRYLQANLKG